MRPTRPLIGVSRRGSPAVGTTFAAGDGRGTAFRRPPAVGRIGTAALTIVAGRWSGAVAIALRGGHRRPASGAGKRDGCAVALKAYLFPLGSRPWRLQARA